MKITKWDLIEIDEKQYKIISVSNDGAFSWETDTGSISTIFPAKLPEWVVVPTEQAWTYKIIPQGVQV